MITGVHRIASLAVLGLVSMVTPALAQTFFDAPTVLPLSAKPSSVRLSIVAGDSGAPLGFAVEWMKRSDFDATGWPADPDPTVRHSEFYGTPDWVVEGSAGSFQLPARHWQAVELGELFDESGILGSAVEELEPGTEYAVRAYILCDTTHPASPYSPTVFVSTMGASTNCTFTLDYWRTHPDAWPATSLTLGTVTYNQPDLLAILNRPAGGNGLVILAHQLIATKLSIMNRADPTAVTASTAAADALIGGLVSPAVGNDSLTPASVNGLATTLDQFNNGLIGPGHCADTPARSTTWGSIKSTYRR